MIDFGKALEKFTNTVSVLNNSTLSNSDRIELLSKEVLGVIHELDDGIEKWVPENLRGVLSIGEQQVARVIAEHAYQTWKAAQNPQANAAPTAALVDQNNS